MLSWFWIACVRNNTDVERKRDNHRGKQVSKEKNSD